MKTWPVLKHYDQQHVAKIALPLGGIGTGTLSLGGRGDFRDCEIMNTPAKGAIGVALNFCVQAQPEGGKTFAKLLEGPFSDFQYEGPSGATAWNHGMPRFRHVTFDAAYPFGQVNLEDDGAPLSATLQAFNPLIPADADASGFPVAVLRYVIRNKTDAPMPVSVCGTANNCTGQDKAGQVWKNTYGAADGLVGLTMTSEGDNAGANSEGEVVLATADKGDVTYREAWLNRGWNVPLLDFWDDFSDDGRLENRSSVNKWQKCSLCLRKVIPANGEETFTFMLSWRFPNRRTWTPLPAEARKDIKPDNDPDIIGNYYCKRFPTAWSAAAEMARRLPELEARTLAFVNAFCSSPLPPEVKEAALFNISTLRTQTAFRTADGNFYGWEGCGNSWGSCHGSCTHVWNYEQTTAFLFGALARNMRETEFMHATRDDGFMSFRVNLPLERAQQSFLAAADGQLGCIMKIYRDWKLSGDDEFLKRLWPNVRRAMSFCWVQGGWDGDADGSMEGCQHNTMDVEYYGPNGQMQGWYIGALQCAERMAKYMGDNEFAEKCGKLAKAAAEVMDKKLFNGDFYEQIIIPPHSLDAIHKGLKSHMGTNDLEHPDAQLGKACLVDQLVGPYFSFILGLPELLDHEHVKKTLQTIWKYNRRQGFHDHFNNMRSFVGGDDTALLMASYPHGDRPVVPFPYFSEVMTGFEYTAAIGMLYAGLKDEGLQVIRDIRARYDGLHRSPFNEAECGHHYARAMAAWASVLALTGYHYDGTTGEMAFTVGDGTWFWSNGNAFGTLAVLDGMLKFTVIEGTVKLETLRVNGVAHDVHQTLRAGEAVRL